MALESSSAFLAGSNPNRRKRRPKPTGLARSGWLRKLGTVGPVLGIAIAFVASGCASIDRLPAVTLAQEAKASVFDIRDARVYVRGTERIVTIAQQAYLRRAKTKAASARQYFLALSGGGDDGAFGAGLLAGWSARGNRPSFDVVTGVAKESSVKKSEAIDFESETSGWK